MKWLVCIGLLALWGCSGAKEQGKAFKIAGGSSSPYDDVLDRLAADDPARVAWNRRAWIAKAGRALGGGTELSRAEVESLLELTDAQVIQNLISRTQFTDAVLGFNLFYLGFPVDRLREGAGNYRSEILRFPQAIDSALETARDGDFFKLLNLHPPVYDPGLTALSAADRQARTAEIQLQGDSLLSLLNLHGPVPGNSQFCTQLQGTFLSTWFNTGVGFNTLFNHILLSNDWFGQLLVACALAQNVPQIDAASEVRRLVRKAPILMERIASSEPAPAMLIGTGLRKLEDLHPVSLDGLQESDPWTFFTDPFKSKLGNSSTNYNRRRAAYALKTFFCDDLTPINIIAPETHGQGAHASEPSCQACHYKLDPMAGFFRDYGLSFQNQSQLSYLVFDDMSVVPRAEYQQAWRAADGAAWKVGFIRSSTRASRNALGSSLEDLFRIARDAPEARRCMVRRMFEYFVGDEQSIDGGFLESLVTEFDPARGTSGQAFKRIAARIVGGKTFRQADPEADQCYDYAPGVEGGTGLPCRVSYIIQKNCVTCHGPNGAMADLDLTQALQNVDGELAEKIVDRLVSTDPQRRMPLNREMDSSEREQLYLWTREQMR